MRCIHVPYSLCWRSLCHIGHRRLPRLFLGPQTGRVSRRQMSRLSRKEHRKRDGGGRDGGGSTAGRGQGFKRHVSFVDDLTPPGTPSHDCPLKQQRRRPDKPFHRRSMTLLEDLDTEQSYPDTLPSPCSLTAARSPKARPRSLLLHQTAENHQQTLLSLLLKGQKDETIIHICTQTNTGIFENT